MTLWQEFRAWVAARKEQREEELIQEVVEMFKDFPGPPPTPYFARLLISKVRHHDKEGLF